MGFKGTFADLALTDVLQVVQMTQKSGVLELEKGDRKASLVFRRGNIVDARPPGAGQYITEDLETAGLIPVGTGARAALEPAAHPGERVGEKLVRLQHVSADALRDFIAKRVENTLSEALAWPEGAFEFHANRGIDPGGPADTIGLSTQHVLLEALRVKDEKEDKMPPAPLVRSRQVQPSGGAPSSVPTPAPAPASAEGEIPMRSAEVLRWQVRRTTGEVLPIESTSVLPTWIIAGRVTREDKVTRDGKSWIRLGLVPDLVPFFTALERAGRPPTGASPAAAPPTAAAPAAPSPSTAPRPAAPAVAAPLERKGRGRRWVLPTVGVLVLGFGIALGRPLLGRHHPAPPSAKYQRLIGLGNDSYSAGRLDAAEAYYQAALTEAPESAEALTLLGLTALDQGKTEEAERALNEAVKADDRYPDAQRYLGRLYDKRGDPARAVAAFRRYLELAPQAPAAAEVRRRMAMLVPPT